VEVRGVGLARTNMGCAPLTKDGLIQRRTLGRTELQVSALGFGAWEIGWTPVDESDEVGHLLNHALDGGIDSSDGNGTTRPSRRHDGLTKIQRQVRMDATLVTSRHLHRSLS
jgi:predicted aldo/keto reductase-like oxidoreductase